MDIYDLINVIPIIGKVITVIDKKYISYAIAPLSAKYTNNACFVYRGTQSKYEYIIIKIMPSDNTNSDINTCTLIPILTLTLTQYLLILIVILLLILT